MTNKPDIIEIVGLYADMKKAGRYYWTLCPLPGHAEKSPSFKVDRERQSFHCFGCGRSGDVINFIQEYKGLSFKEALAYLGIAAGKPLKPDKRDLLRRDLIATFRRWEREYCNRLCDLLRNLDGVKLRIKTEIEVEAFALYYHRESLWTYHLEILLSKDDDEKLVLYKELVYGN